MSRKNGKNNPQMFSPDAGFKCVICSLWKTVKPSSKCNSIHTEAGFFTKKTNKKCMGTYITPVIV